MSYEANFGACKNHAKQNTDSLTVWKWYFECPTVLIGAMLNLIISLTENKVAENGVIVGFSLRKPYEQLISHGVYYCLI